MTNMYLLCLLYQDMLIAGCEIELRHERQKPNRPCPLLQKGFSR